MNSTEPPTATLSSADLLRLDELCDQFESQINSAQPILMFDLLTPTADPLRTALARELLAIELEHRLSRGEDPTPQDYAGCPGINADEFESILTRMKSRAGRTSRVGAYDLVEVLGKGSFGTVWRAIDTQLGRQVAVKIAHANLTDSPEAFLREARSAAQLQHPNIVRMLDMGESDGQLYLVREFIDGIPLSARIRESPLEPRRAAPICLQIAEALIHSHAHGCIHRDLKPQNVLLDAGEMAYLMDFGLAKSDAHQGTATRSGDFMGTPAYMAPEQARGESRQADARTDVYGLGVILFEALTSELPFRGSVEMLVAQILNDDPPNPAQLRQGIPSDLASICLKCLEKDPRNRYLTAADLAEDLRRFLNGTPTIARPLSRWQRAWRWADRNRAVASLLAATIFLISTVAVGGMVSTITITRAWENERTLREKADAARTRADLAAETAKTEAEISQQVTVFLENVFAVSDPVGLTLQGGKHEPSKASARELALRAVARIDNELANQPRVQARLMDVLGNILRSVGSFDEAERLLLRAASVRQAITIKSPDIDLRAESANNLFLRGWLKHALGEYAAATDLYSQALASRRTLSGENSLAVAEVEFHLGWLKTEQQQPKQAKLHLTNALRIRKAHLPPKHQLVVLAEIALWQCEPNLNEVSALSALGVEILGKEVAGPVVIEVLKIRLARKLRDYTTANTAYRDLLTLIRPHLGPDHPIIALVQGDYAGFLWDSGDYVEAEAAIMDALRIGRRIAPKHPHMLRALKQTAFEMWYAGRHEEAEKLYREALAFPGQAGPSLAEITHGLTWCCFIGGNRNEALAFSEQTLKLSSKASLEFAAWARYCHARMLANHGQAEEARTLDEEALQLVRSIDMKKQAPTFLDQFAVIYGHNKDLPSAEKLLRQAILEEEKNRPADHPRVADRLNALGRILLRQERPAEAAPLLRRALAIREKRLPADDQRLTDTRKLVKQLASVP